MVLVGDSKGHLVGWDAAAELVLPGLSTDGPGRPISELLRLPGHMARLPDGAEVDATVVDVQVEWPGAGTAQLWILRPVDISSPSWSQRAEQWLNALVYRASEVAFIVDELGVVRFVADVANPPLGYKTGDTVGRSAFDFVHPDDQALAHALFEESLTVSGPQEAVQLHGMASDGSWRLVEITVSNLLDNPIVAGLVVNMRDVTEQRAMEEALRASETRYRAIVETAQEGIWLIDETGRTLFSNQSLSHLLHRKMDDIARLNIFEVIDPTDRAEARRRLASRRHAGHEVYEIPFARGDGERRWATVSASPMYIDEDYLGSLLMISDITERKKTEAELQRRALYDDVTGLPNRMLLQDRLDQALRRRATTGSVAVYFIDLDDFKAVNDSYGHDAGDQLLRSVAQRLEKVVRDGDTLARFAGDEFVVVGREMEGEIEANHLAERILEALAEPVQVHGHLVTVNASIGVALQHSSTDGEQLLRDADLAMFEAKKQGRGRHVMFDPDAIRQSRYHLQDVDELRSGLERGELEVFYQPQVDLSTGAVCAVEALARWRHPSRGLIEPSEFIGLAEASGLIGQLGRQVLMSSCSRAAEWARTLREPVPVAVNVSARQLDDDSLPATVQEALQTSQLAPGLLGLEITETAVMSNPERALRVLTELRQQGVHLAIDDFGTGYSSLLHLKRLPVDEIKIDRGFVDGVVDLGDDRSIVGAVLSMAKALELRVVGEGVETEEQAQALFDLGCRIGQGFLYGRPLDAAHIEGRLREEVRGGR